MFNETNSTPKQTERFSFWHLDGPKGGSLAIWDRDGPAPSEGRIFLYVYRRDTIIEFVSDLVRKNIHPADDAEIKYLSSKALESYFCALSRHYKEIRKRREEYDLYPEKPAGWECYACGGSGYERGRQQYGVINCAVCGGTGRTF